MSVLFVLVTSLASGEQNKLRDISWQELGRASALPEGATLEDDGSLRLSSDEAGLTRTLVELVSPPIEKDLYVVRGRIRYKDVEGDGYLEMWSHFPGGSGSYFTRTLASEGPLGKISGSSDWRDLGLYFDATEAASPPERLTINLVLSARGVVSISPLELVELDRGDLPGFGGGGAGGGHGSAAGLWAGLAGTAIGVLGGLFGWLGGRGRAKGLVLTGLRTMIALGAVGIAVGIVDLARGLPYAVYFPLLLLGTVAIIAPASALPALKRRYEELELRRMHALDV